MAMTNTRTGRGMTMGSRARAGTIAALEEDPTLVDGLLHMTKRGVGDI